MPQRTCLYFLKIHNRYILALNLTQNRFILPTVKHEKGVLYMDNENEYENFTDNDMRYEPAQTGKKAFIRTRSAVAICVVCSLICGIFSAGSYALIDHFTDRTGTEGQASYFSVAASGGSNVSSDASKTAAGTENKVQENVTINAENVISPATAVARKVSPSIVGIRVTTVTNYGPYGDYSSSGEGSGIIYSSDGYIITNYHVIEGTVTSSGEPNPNSTLSVYLYQSENESYTGTVIGYDQSADLAVIKIDASGLVPIEIGDSDTVNVGDIAVAIGNPGGLEFMGSASQGIISGLNRTIQAESSYEDLKLIQTDAAINPGNSGGALCNAEGKLIGVNSVKLVDTSYEGMGFAIPVNDAVSICDSIIADGSKSTVYLGLEFNENYTAEVLRRQGYPEGIVVSSVAQGSPAEKAGFETDDILTSFNGTAISSTEDLIAARNACVSGQTVYVKVYRLTLQGTGFIRRWTGDYIDMAVTFD